jgi:hypothetical protein
MWTKLTLATVALFVVAGCGGDEESKDRSAVERSTTPVTEPGADVQSPGEDEQQRAPARDDAAAEGEVERGKPRTLPNGTVIIPPKPPATEELHSSDACEETTVDRGGRDARVTVPPTPGISASIEGRVVRVRYDTGRPPRACRPYYISVLVNADDGTPPIGRRVRLRDLGVGQIRVSLPDYFARPKVASATLGTKRGYTSETARVTIASDS